MTDLSVDVREPDILEVKILRPDLIIDAETFEKISSEESLPLLETIIFPQITEGEFIELESMQEDAETVGLTFGVWQLCMMIALGKAINSMWVLINTTQFFVYIS